MSTVYIKSPIGFVEITSYGGGIHRKEWLLDFEAPYKQGELFV